MKIAFVAPEMVPFAKTGGLGDVTGSLPKELQALGHEVHAFLPLYRSVHLGKDTFGVLIQDLRVPLGSSDVSVRILHGKLPSGCSLYFVDYPEFFLRDELYGTRHGEYPDNDRRFTLFARAVLETLRKLEIQPDIFHCHDWQSGLVPVYLKTLYAKTRIFKKARSVFTVHNLAYQGNFPPDSLPNTGLGWEEFSIDRLEFYGKISFLKGGLMYADAITTVSERYAKEIQTKEFGRGLEGVLTKRRDYLFGVMNGIDYSEWNPKTDPDIAARFEAGHPKPKAKNKAALQKDSGFSVRPDVPLCSFISRLVPQKGLDILIPAMEELAKLDLQFVLLGTGEEKYHKILREIGKRYKKNFKIRIVFDPYRAKRIYAGSDFLLVPSYYEPCGLSQMIALRYGTIPIVRMTGGLADAVTGYDTATGKGNGFVFSDYTTEALVEAVRKAVNVYRSGTPWQKILSNAMHCDYSWTASAKRYVEIFEAVQRGKIQNQRK